MRGGGVRKVAIVTFGNGVRTALQYAHAAARTAKQQQQQQQHGGDTPTLLVSVIDSPCISQTPAQLRDLLPHFDAVVFADVCKVRRACVRVHVCVVVCLRTNAHVRVCLFYIPIASRNASSRAAPSSPSPA